MHLLFRYQYSYKIGYTPKMRMRKIFKLMKNRAKYILTPRNGKTYKNISYYQPPQLISAGSQLKV